MSSKEQENESHSGVDKPISLHGVGFKNAIKDLLKVKPEKEETRANKPRKKKSK